MKSSRMTAPPLRLVKPSLETVEEDHEIQLILCNDLEAVADKLPDMPTMAELRRLCDRILRVTGTHFTRAELVLGQLPTESRPEVETFKALRTMHLLDEIHGQDLVVALWQHVGHPGTSHVGELGYMLRCFFDGCRRAVALKDSLIAAARRPVMMD